MCVIFVVDRTRPPEDMIEKAFDANDSGSGVAWREGEAVHWEKGLTVDRVKELCATVPLPYVAHFRIPTCGGPSKDLCHPFPISRDVPNFLEGSFKGHVLFHNGHWSDWKKIILEAAVKNNLQVPTGKWSDSRAMAFAASVYGLGFLEMVDEKCVAFGPGPTDLDIFGVVAPHAWNRINDIWCSNRMWETTSTTYLGIGYTGGVMCRVRTCTENKWGNTLFCEKHQPKETVRVLCKMLTCTSTRYAATDYCYQHQLSATRESGGVPTETPFERALRERKTGVISKKQYKRIVRELEKEKMALKLPQIQIPIME